MPRALELPWQLEFLPVARSGGGKPRLAGGAGEAVRGEARAGFERAGFGVESEASMGAGHLAGQALVTQKVS